MKRFPAIALALLVIAMASAACSTATLASTATPSPTPAPASTATVTPPASTTPTPTPVQGLPVSPQLQQQLDLIEQRVKEIRGLSDSALKKVEIVTRAQMKQVLESQPNTDTAKLQTTQSLLRFLHLIGPNADLAKIEQDQLNQEVLGLFDEQSGNLYVVTQSGQFGPLEQYTYAHEYTHSLQQGTFDIAATENKIANDSEASAAFTALVEGDAVLTQTLYAEKYLNLSEIQQQESQLVATLPSYPRFIQDDLEFPYTAGLSFVVNLYQSGGYQAINEAFKNPPVDTEQILHPEKYLAHQLPQKVSLPDLASALGQGWSKLDSDVLGAFDLQDYLAGQVGQSMAAQAAAGWVGDRYQFLKGPNGQQVFVDLLQWDSPQDAQEFLTTFAAFMKDEGSPVQQTASKVSGTELGQFNVVSEQGQSTLLVIASDQATASAVEARFPGY